jgi:uncharacterized protein DUF3631
MAIPDYRPRDPVAEYRRVLEAEPALLAAAENIRNSESATDDGPTLVKDVEAFLRRFVVLPAHTILPLALWAIATFAFKLFDAFPYLAITSPTKRCGKTRLLECLELLSHEARRAANPSEAALFRMIEKYGPTLLLDEAETLNGKGERAEYLRALLNAGNRRNASVPRCVGHGTNQDVQDFSIYCPKIVAGIGRFPDTVTDRAICILMQRRKNSEVVSRFLYRSAEPEGRALRERSEQFVSEHTAEIETIYETADLPFLADRDAEAWQPLFVLLAILDGGRLSELRHCAEILTQSKSSNADDDSLAQRLLIDLRAVWPESETHALTADLLVRLKAIEESPWAAEVELNPRKLARMLRGFGIRPATVRADGRNAKGYNREDTEAAFSRYLPPETSHASQAA